MTAAQPPRPVLCRECRHFIQRAYHFDYYDHPRCLHRASASLTSKQWTETRIMRAEGGACGPAGVLFEARPWWDRHGMILTVCGTLVAFGAIAWWILA